MDVDATDNNAISSLEKFAFPLGEHTHECGYFKDRDATEKAWLANDLDPEMYADLMDQRFRRSGKIIYTPKCEGCQLCVPIRIPVDDFKPSKSQRRAVKRNQDVTVNASRPEFTTEKHEVYQAYLASQHGHSSQGEDAESMREFLYSSCVNTHELCYRDAEGQLLGVSILDLSKDAMSSVYHYFNPAKPKRSMGVYSIVREIELARKLGQEWYYLGFWVRGCRAMDYKCDYHPHELLINGEWERKVSRPT
ncbi:arginyltransferase [Planctomycetota bacterium]|nr:arginyltransferase [Planctomycetota bacterium]